MKHYIDLIEDEISSVKGQRQYCLDVMAKGGLQSWQSKEYSDLIEQYEVKLVELQTRLEMVKGYE